MRTINYVNGNLTDLKRAIDNDKRVYYHNDPIDVIDFNSYNEFGYLNNTLTIYVNGVPMRVSLSELIIN